MMPDKMHIPRLPSLPAGLLGLLLLSPSVQALAHGQDDLAEASTQLARNDQEHGPDLQRRLQEWRNMPADKRESIKQKRDAFERLDPAEQQRLREEFQARKSLRDRG